MEKERGEEEEGCHGGKKEEAASVSHLVLEKVPQVVSYEEFQDLSKRSGDLRKEDSRIWKLVELNRRKGIALLVK